MTSYYSFETLTLEHQQEMLREARLDALAAQISHPRPVAAYRIYLARRLREVAERIDDAKVSSPMSAAKAA